MDRPNVLLICVEHWSGRLIGALGHPTVLTPTLDQLVRNGAVYTNAYSTSPVCIPARRELTTGTFSRTHGTRSFDTALTMSGHTTLAQTFRDAGYQAYAVGKLHVEPQRDRIGFDDVLLDVAGDHRPGLTTDDYELFLAEQGFGGQEFTHGSGNDYYSRPWHLPEHTHSANWTAREMCRYIVRRDPTRPAFWYLSFVSPHPPLTPPAAYMDLYRREEIDLPFMGDWARRIEDLPYAYVAGAHNVQRRSYSESVVRTARQAYYAQCTHVDNQIRLVIGTLREEGLLHRTIVMLTADHGDMLGNHGLYGKGTYYEDSAKVPMILVPTADYARVEAGTVDNRLAALADVMPTLLDLCDIPVPEVVEGLSLVGEQRRDHLYGELKEDGSATRMVHDGRHKLIYYPVGNRTQLFDMKNDPDEMADLAEEPTYQKVREDLTRLMLDKLYGSDLECVDGDKLVGLPEPERPDVPPPDRGMRAQYGWRFK